MISEFLGPVGLPVGPSAFSFGATFTDFVGFVEEVCGDCMFGACVNHFFREDGDSGISCKRLTTLLLFGVDDQWFVDVHWLVKEDFVVVNHDVDDESVSVKNVEDNILEDALVLSFIWVPEFDNVVIWDVSMS